MPPVQERVLSYPDALAEVLQQAQTLPLPSKQEIVPLAESPGRVLAEPILAERDQPPFPRSTRDGYAVRAADLTSGAPLRLVGSLRAGERPTDTPINAGEALEIMTGAPVPPMAEAVLMYEHALVSNDTVRPADGRTLAPGENIVPRAAEARQGAELVAPGRRLAAPEIALAATCGLASLSVYAKPTVAIIATGDELVELDAVPEPWQIRNSNTHALAALVREAGGEPILLPIAHDTREDLEARLAAASTADLLLLSGGVSMGKYDLVEEVLTTHHASFHFTGTLIQPGKPLVFGALPGIHEQYSTANGQQRTENGERKNVQRRTYNVQPFFGLPGNPVSTEVCFRLFVTPLLRALAGQTDVAPRFLEARLAEDLRSGTRVTRFLPATLTTDWHSATIRLVPWQGSGDLAANARANCFAVLPAGHPPLPTGSTVRVLLR